MIEKFKDYKEIKKAYPKTMSKDQFYKVAHISKATALFLLKTGLVPCKDSKKKTRRYTIKTKDVISYMQERIVSPEKFRAADGWYLTRSGYGKSKDTGKDKLMSLTPEQCELLRQYFENELTDYNDLMTTYEFATFLGYCRTCSLNCNGYSGNDFILHHYEAFRNADRILGGERNVEEKERSINYGKYDCYAPEYDSCMCIPCHHLWSICRDI